MNEKEKNQQFVNFLYVCKQFSTANLKVNLAFWMGVWYGEEKRESVVHDDETLFAFEWGLHLAPLFKLLDKAVVKALLASAITGIVGAFKIKEDK